MAPSPGPPTLLDLNPTQDDLLSQALEGLSGTPKTLPCKLFYDATGADLFDRICELEEYYPTRTELSILRRHLGAMVERIGPGALLIEYGSGNCLKTRLLLGMLRDPVGYVPIDISREQIKGSARQLAKEFPAIEILPVCADYSQPIEIPRPRRSESRRVVFFPGSTIGNFHRPDARRFLQRMRRLVGPEGGALIGVDLQKDREILQAAYNDRRGVTALFNLNALRRLNHECGTDFDLGAFRHRAFYNAPEGRIEMHLVSLRNQTVRLNGSAVAFRTGETVRTECSYKYTLEGFGDLARSSGFQVDHVWTDPQSLFSVQYLVGMR